MHTKQMVIFYPMNEHHTMPISLVLELVYKGFVYIFFFTFYIQKKRNIYRSPRFGVCLLQTLGDENSKYGYNMRKKHFYDKIQNQILNKSIKMEVKGIKYDLKIVWGICTDLAAIRRDKGLTGNAGWAPFADVVIFDPADPDKLEYIPKADAFENASLPIIYTDELDEKKSAEKHLSFN